MKLFRKENGFSLIEAAIVLGIIGLVIGGIWVAAEAVIINNQVNTANTRSHKIVQDLMHLYKGQQLPTTFTDLTPTLIAANIIPPDMVSNGQAKHVWGGAFEVVVSSASTLQVTFYNVPKSACAKFIISNITDINPGTWVSREGIFLIDMDGTTTVVNPANFVSVISNACKTRGQTYISFYYAKNYL